ncbi:MAG: hypothetical protein ABI286_07600 [Edaphobacter sp.]
MAICAPHQNLIHSHTITEPAPSIRLQQLIDNGTIYVAQSMNPSQFATLQAVAALVLHSNAKSFAAQIDALANSSSETFSFNSRSLPAFDYRLGLDELDFLTRTRTGYAFVELSSDLQDAILDLIASRDLTTRKLDLARWLEDLHANAAAL